LLQYFRENEFLCESLCSLRDSVYSVVNPVVDSILCANKAIACYIPVSKRAASCLVTET